MHCLHRGCIDVPYYTVLYVTFARASARSKKCFSAIVIQNLETFPRCGHQCLEKVEDGLRTLFTSEGVDTFSILTCTTVRVDGEHALTFVV